MRSSTKDLFWVNDDLFGLAGNILTRDVMLSVKTARTGEP